MTSGRRTCCTLLAIVGPADVVAHQGIGATSVALSLAASVLGARLRVGGNGCSDLVPFDCFVEKGADYEGLVHLTLSGRACKNWLDQNTYPSTTKGIGNHNYCRNPDGSKDKPWCYTLDPETEWEYCVVEECPAQGAPPEPWKAPSGAKSQEAAGPCVYVPPATPKFKEHKPGRACLDHRGSTWWLISNNNLTAADASACYSQCAELPGTEYFTFWTALSESNCGCYRQCVLVPEDLTVNSPTVFRVA
mmetsp:Transcript_58650/g.136399  ORF Transcript_58650/g.136399 Transcript_58650/m.136399 type:complete len:248 (+) Transcript_58650:142-885(+)